MTYTPQEELTHLLCLLRTIDYQIGTLKGETRGYLKQRVNGIESWVKNAENGILSSLSTSDRLATLQYLDDMAALYWHQFDEFRAAESKTELLALCTSYNAGEVQIVPDG